MTEPSRIESVARRVREILEATDAKVAKDFGDDLPAEGSRLLSVEFQAEDQTDVDAVELLVSRGLAQWEPGALRLPGDTFSVEALASLRVGANAGQAKATLALAARIDALEGMLDKLIGQNERLVEAAAAEKPKELPEAKKKPAAKAKKAAKKKGAARG
jgi:hypothetical protein